MADERSTPESNVPIEGDSALRRDPEASSTIADTQKPGVAPEQANDFVLDGMVDTQDTSSKSAIHHGSATTRDPALEENYDLGGSGSSGNPPRADLSTGNPPSISPYDGVQPTDAQIDGIPNPPSLTAATPISTPNLSGLNPIGSSVDLPDVAQLQSTPPTQSFESSDVPTATTSGGGGGGGGTGGGPDPITGTIAVNDGAILDEDQSVLINVLANDSDLDGDPLSVTAATADNGSVSIRPDGTLDYTPNTNFNGTDTLTYTISDGNGSTDTATVSITVNPINDGPDAVDDVLSVDEDTGVIISVLANDSDLDGDTLSVTAASASNGSVSIRPDGALDYTPNSEFSGTDTITYTITDGNGGTDTATVSITVNPVNDAPDALNDAASLDEDTTVNITVLTNDSDVEGDALSVTGAIAGNGSVSIRPDGTLDYTPNTDFNGVDTLTYTISDGNGGTDTATVSITVNPTNDGPAALDDTASVDEDGAVTISVLANDSDLDGDALSVTNATAGNGSVSIRPDGSLDYTPNSNFNGTDTVTYIISDGNGGTDTATVTITVNPVNDGPTALDDTASVNEDDSVSINVLANDSDLDGDALSVTGATAGNGSVSIRPDGTLDYTPDANFNGTDTITYTVSDGAGGTDTATVTITVNPVNDGPDALNDSASVAEDGNVTINVLVNDSDVDGDALSVTTASAANGSVSIRPDGALDYTPNASFNGTDTVTYTISDGNGGTDTATVSITVNPVNDGPTALDDTASVNEDDSVSIDVLANDSDLDGDALSVTSATAGNGSVSIRPDGTLDYTPDANFNGTDTVTYTVSDGNGGTDTATVTVTVNAVNDGPDALNDSASVVENGNVTINVLVNDSDVDGDTLSVTAASAGNGSVSIRPDGALDYTPNTSFNGTDTVTYTISDGNGGTDTATVSITVSSVNDGPTAVDDTASVDEDGSVTIGVLANDSDLEGDALSVTAATAGNGSVSIRPDGALDYTPNTNFNGTDTVTYTISDGNGGTDTATVTVTVNAVNDGPDALNDTASVVEDGSVTISVLVNDSDLDGDALSVTAATAGNGSVSIRPDGSLDYTPNSNFNGTDTVTYTISDGNGGTDTATVSITVNPANDGPTAVDDTASVNEDGGVNINVLANDSDLDGDPLSVTGATAGNGTVSVRPDGTLDYTPDANFNGTDTVTYTVTDGAGGTDTATVTITVNPVNDGPIALDDTASVDEDGSVTIGVLANDSDVEGDALSVTAATAGNGSVSIRPDGSLDYTPNTNFNGTDTVTYTISDGNGGTDTATVTITVNSVNDGPTALDDTASVDEDSSVTIGVLANDSDVEGDALSVTAATAGNGSVSIRPDGSLDYTPNSNFNGTDTVTYTISDGNGGTDTATVTVTVNSVNDGPVALDDTASVNEDSSVTIGVLANDSDLDGDALSVTAATAGNGSVSIRPDGSLDYTPNTNFNGTDTVTYTISDGNGGTDTATVTVTVNSVNDGPVALDDTASVDEDSTVTIGVLANDSDLDGDALSVTSASAGNGSVSIRPDGSLDYTPNANFNGTDTLTYTISDGNGGTDTATVAITINPQNDAVIARNDTASVDEDSAVTIGVLANDSDFEGDTLSVLSASAGNGSVSIRPDGSLDYTPNTNFNGTDTVTYTISDGNGSTDTATVSVTVNPMNDGPTALDDTASVDEDSSVTIGVLANDSDLDGDALSVTAATAGNGSVSIRPDGSLDYTPNSNFNGTDTVTYTISDGNGGTDTATVSITVNPTNDGPVALDDTASVDEDSSVVIGVLANDSDLDGDALSVTAATAGNGSVSIRPDGALDYTPNTNFNGTDTVTYTISDGNGGTDTATVSITVNPTNDGPVALDDTASVDEDSSVVIGVLANDSDLDGDALSVTAATAGNGSVSIRPDGALDYTPNTNFNGTDTVTYTISDGNGGTDTATVSITVNPMNDGPVALDDTASVDEDSSVTIGVLANDSDLDGDALSVTAATAGNGSVSIRPDGSLDYTPNTNFNGTDTVTYTISDGNGGTDTATVTVTVNSVNDGPVALDDTASVDEDSTVTIGVLANDSDLDGDALSVTAATAGNGSVSIRPDGSLDYTPNSNFNGTDTVTYTISDGNGGTDTATVSITVNSVNDGPVALDDTASVDEDSSVTIGVLANDSDLDGDALSVTSASAGNGSVSIRPDGSLDYTPNTNFNGTDTVTYTISDGNGGTDTATVTVTVNSVNDGPVALDDTASVDEDSSVTIGVLANDSDLDGDALSVTAATAGNGSVSIRPDGSLDYTPNSNFNGTDTVTYTISDGNGGTDTATVSITVNPMNDGPVALDDTASVDEDSSVTIGVLANDSDLDGDALSVTSASAGNGSVSIRPDGSLDYTPNANYNGTDTLTYTISDGNGGTDTATVNITVNSQNDAVVARNDTASVDEDSAVTIGVLANDSDFEGDTLSVLSASAGNGSVSIRPDGSLDYTPNSNFNGTDTVTYTISDGNGSTDTATVSVTVNPINDGPVALDDTASVDEDSSVVIGVLANDSDLDGDALSVTSASAGNGSVSIRPDGSLDYTPNTNFNGTDTVTYTISDGNGGTDTATVSITVNSANDGPVALDDTASVNEDSSVVIGVLANDSDLDGDALSVTSASAGNGSVSIRPDGALDYTPNTNFNGTDTVTYTISDGNGGTDTATVSITVNSVNDGPVALDDTASVDEDSSVVIGVLANDSDLDGDALSVTSASAGNGSVSIRPDGSLDYTPNTNFNGTDTVTYTISDGNGGTDTATVSITVNSVNDGPVALDDTASVNEDSSVVIGVLANDSDLDGDALSVTSASAGNGSVSIRPDGSLDYTPNTNFNGTDTVTYTISDGNGGTDTATVSITVNSANDGPVALDDTASVNEDSSVVIGVLANDSDLDGDALSVTSASAGNGSVSIRPDGSLDYTPNSNFNGTDTVTYTISDGNGGTDTATVSITVNPMNDGPVALDDTASVDEDSSVVIGVLANDSDLDGDALSVTSASAGNGSVSIRPDGALDYTPNTNFNGTDTVTYTISDGNGGTDTATVSITVNAVNDGPVALDDTASVDEDSSVTIGVLANDSDLDGDALSVTAASAGNGSVSIRPDGSLDYTPNTNFNGTDTVTYTISDGNGGTDTATVSITVNSVNDGPVALDDTASVDEDSSVVIGVLTNDSDLDGDALSVTSAAAGNGSVSIRPDGSLDYTPNTNFNGTDTVTYTISDGNGGTDTATVSITVNSVNDGPVALDDTASVDEDSSVVIGVLANDSDLDGDALSVTSASAGNGSVSIRPDGSLDYTPNTNFNGTDTVTYTISDGNGGTDTATVSITVNSVNDGPVALDDTASVDEDSSVVIGVLANDSDLDGDALSVTSASAGNGSVSIRPDGSLDYTPNTNFNGTDTVTYTISDGNGGTDTATVSITVNSVNDGPVALDDTASVDEDSSVVIGVLANDSDLDGDALSVTAATAGNGSVSIRPDGALDYTPNTNFNGTDTVTYTISDGNGGTDTATVSITVNAVNDGPVALDDTASVDEDSSVVIGVLTNDSDLDGDALSVTAATAGNGSVSIRPDGALDYTPNSNFNGTDTVTYTISDGNGGTDTATVSITVNSVNDGPVALDDTASVDEDSSVVIGVLANDSDLDGDALSVTSASAGNGSVSIRPDGSLDYTPNTNFNGTDTVTYTISDGNGGTDTATVSITVNSVNDGPVALDDTASVNEDSSVVIGVLANDSDLDGDALSVTSASAGNGSVSIRPDGSLDYTPNSNFNGTDTVTYTISDGNGGTDTATVSITVNAVNDGPVALDDTASVDEDSSVTIGVLANDSDLDGDALSVTAATAGNGSVSIRPDGSLDYTPNSNFNGTDTVTYTISDGNGGTDTATVSITVNSVNDGPVALDDTASVDEDSSVVIGVLTNDSDLDGDALSVTAATAGNGSVSIRPDGSLDYTPNSNFNGTDTVTYTISDGNGGTDTATVSITVNSVNDGPVALDDTASVDEDSSVTIGVLANDSDLDGDALSVTSASAGNGSVSIRPDGSLDYTPNTNFNGTDTVTYTISDGNGGTDTATVSITVNSVNDGPVALDDTASVDEDSSVVIGVLANDSDLDGDALSVTSASAGNGSVSIRPDGSLDYTPNTNFNGTDTVTYTISDGNGGTDTATVSITVNAVNDGPVALDDTASVDEDSSVTIGVLANDSDLDGDALSVTSASAGNGSVSIRPDGSLDYTPNSNFNGTDTVTYTISDGAGGTDTATVSITVNPVNDDVSDLTFTGGSIVETDEPGTVAATATAVDIDTGDTHTYSLVDDGEGRFEIDTNSGDIMIKDIDVDADGATVGTGGTLAMWFDPDTISGSEGDPVATLSDQGSNSNDGSQGTSGQQPTLTLDGPFGNQGIQFDGVDDILTVANASEINATSATDKSFVMTLQSGADIETRQVIYEEGGGTNGMNLYIDGGQIYFGIWNDLGGVATDDVSAFVSADINPYTDYVATFVFDGGDGTLTAFVNGIEIGSLPFAGPLNSHTDGVGLGGTNGTTVFHDATDPAGSENFSGIIGEFAYYDETALSQLDVWGLTHEMSNGEIDPFVDQTEPTIDLVVSTTDGVGAPYTETVTINVTDANFAPGDVVFYNDAAQTTEITVGTVDENSAAGTLVAYLDVADQNLEDTHTFTIDVGDPNFEIVNGNELVLKTGANLDYEADPSHAVTVDVTVTDSDGASYVETFTINLNDVNDPVIAQDDAVTASEDSALAGDVLVDNGSGADSDQDGDALTITEINGSSASVGTQIALGSGALLTLNSDGTFDYDPNGQFESLNTGETATDSFTYTVDDGNGSSDTATVTVTIDGVSDAPTAGDVDLGAILEDNSLIITEAQLLANSTDPDSSSGDLSISNVGVSASFGTIVDNMNGTWTFTPVADLHADDLPITFTVEDEGSRSDTATATLDITAVADPITSLNINAATGHYFTQVAFTDGESAPGATVDADGFAFPTFEGWDAPTGNLIEIRNFETSTTGGNWHIEIDDDPFDNYVDAGEIFQEFETSAGANYTLSFDWSPRPGVTATVNTIEIVWDGQVVAVLSRDGTGLTNPDWQSYTINVTGTGNLERLTIREPDYAEQDYGRGIFVDNLHVMTDGEAQANGAENTAIDVSSIDVTFGSDTDGSERHVLNMDNIPVGAVLADGSGHTFTSTTGNTSIDLYDSFGLAADNWDLSTLTITPPTDFVGNFDLNVTATATEQSNSDTASSNTTLTVHVYDAGSVRGDDTSNTIVGTTGADHIVGGGGDDNLSGGGWNDYVAGDAGDDVISGGAGYDQLFGGEGNDTITGGSEDDILYGGMGNDSLDGGGNNDTAAFNLDQFAVVANLTAGTATGQGTDTLVNIENLTGSDLADTLTGDGGANILRGGAGNDTISGMAGDDEIEGGTGDDVLSGGDGNDIFFITGDGSDGDDTIQGGSGGAWTDVIQMTNPGVLGADWSYTLTSGSLVSSGTNFLQFSADAAGDIDLGNDTFDDIAFSDLERIEW